MTFRNLLSATMAWIAVTATAAVPFKNGTSFALNVAVAGDYDCL